LKANRNGILDPESSKPLANLDNIGGQHAKSRNTASSLESVYNDYVDRGKGAGTKATVVVETSESLKKHSQGYKGLNRPSTNYPRNVGYHDGLSNPHPGFIEGHGMLQCDPLTVDEHVPELPSTEATPALSPCHK
jgi:hypothetical protein